MYQTLILKSQLIVFYLLIASVTCLLEDHIEFYNQKSIRKIVTSPATKFSIFHKRTRPIYRKSDHLLNDYKLVSDQQVNSSTTDQAQSSTPYGRQQSMQLNRSKERVEFVDIDGNTNRYDPLNSTNQPDVSSLTYAQKTARAFEHALRMKIQAKCDQPKQTIVYLNQNKKQIKFYMPRATILHRCGQNTGCCENESEKCVAIEQEQVNVYFFVIKLEREFDAFDENRLTSVRRGRKYAPINEDSNDNSLLKEYEYNLDYSTNNEIRPNDRELENNYLNMLLNQDDALNTRLTRSIEQDVSTEIATRLRNLSDGESKLTKHGRMNRINSKRPHSDLFDDNQRYNRRSSKFRNHIRRSLGGLQMPKQTIEILTFINHTRCACVNGL